VPWSSWSPLNEAPVWSRNILTIILVIVATFLLARLVTLPFDRLRLRFGAKPRIDARLLQQDSIRQPDHSLSRGIPLGPKNQIPDVDVGSWTFHLRITRNLLSPIAIVTLRISRARILISRGRRGRSGNHSTAIMPANFDKTYVSAMSHPDYRGVEFLGSCVTAFTSQ
jgi:hypothetical protein